MDDSTSQDRISELMRSFVDAGELAGAVTLVARHGEILHFEAVGHADVESNQPMHRDSLFAVASITKPITATAVMSLQDEGRLSIDDPVSRYLPRFREAHLLTGPAKVEMTIRHLLTHTSGISDFPRRAFVPLTLTWELEDTVDLLARLPLQFEPGTRWNYSTGLHVAARIAEVVSGTPFDVLLQERIFRPLQMKDTTFFPTAEQRARLARNHRLAEDRKSVQPDPHWMQDLSVPRTPNPSAGLFSTADDLYRFLRMIQLGGALDGTRVVSESAVQAMTTAQTGNLQAGFLPGNAWGLGWCVVREPQGETAALSPGTFGHAGALGTEGWIDPRRGLIYILLTQRTEFNDTGGARIMRAFQDLAIQIASESSQPS